MLLPYAAPAADREASLREFHVVGAADPQKGEWNMSRDAFFPGLVSVVRIVILWCSAFWLFTMTEYREIYGVALGPFLLFASVRS